MKIRSLLLAVIATLTCCQGIFMSAQAATDGPYYLQITNYCDRYRLYKSTPNLVYGKNIGCSGTASYGLLVTGGFDGDTVYLGYAYNNQQRLRTFTLKDLSTAFYGLDSDGKVLSRIAVGSWSFVNPDRTDTDSLPAVDDLPMDPPRDP